MANESQKLIRLIVDPVFVASLVEANHRGRPSVRLDRFLVAQLPIAIGVSVSRSLVRELVEAEKIQVNGKGVKVSQSLAGGEVVTLERRDIEIASAPPHYEAVPMDLVILYEDADVVVVNKPSGIAVHPGAGPAGKSVPTLVQGVLAHVGKKMAEEFAIEPIRPGVVHRLDKDTTGAIVFAKNRAAHQVLAEQFAAKTNLRQYIALLDGAMAQEQIVVESILARDPGDRKRFRSVPLQSKAEQSQAGESEEAGEPRDDEADEADEVGEAGGEMVTEENSIDEQSGAPNERISARQPTAKGRYAKSFFKRENVFANRLTLASIRLFTGRTHQIRIHARDLGLPVIGDQIYGRRITKGSLGKDLAAAMGETVEILADCKRQMLHAWILGFNHPVTGKNIRLEAPLPQDFTLILKRLNTLL